MQRRRDARCRCRRRESIHDDRRRSSDGHHDIRRLTDDLATLTRAAAAQDRHARELAQARRAAELTWQHGELDWPTYLTIRANALGADLDRLDLRQRRATAAIALSALLGSTDLTPASPPARAATP